MLMCLKNHRFQIFPIQLQMVIGPVGFFFNLFLSRRCVLKYLIIAVSLLTRHQKLNWKEKWNKTLTFSGFFCSGHCRRVEQPTETEDWPTIIEDWPTKKEQKQKPIQMEKKWLKNIMKKIPENFNENMAWQTTMLGFSTELCLLKSCGTWGWRRWLIAILCVCAQRIDFSFYLL